MQQTTPYAPHDADKEKQQAALASVTAAVLLTLLKLAVGLFTNSLGILSEAAHSGFDLVAAGITFFAVRYAAFPPDSNHPYGHGKIENLSALIESLLLLITCVWIIWEAIDRLFFTHVVVTPSLWAVGVMLISIVVDISRSRMLMRIAKKHRSQALEADALHFSTDILSSAVVLIGIGALYLAMFFPADSFLRQALERADSIAALAVSCIIIHISYDLGKKAINILLDAGDVALSQQIEHQVAAIPGIESISSIRLRHSGADLFVDITATVAATLLLDETDPIRQQISQTVQGIADHADVTITFMPHEPAPTDRIAVLRKLAASYGLIPHAVALHDLEATANSGREELIDMHVEFPPDLSLGEAYAKVSPFEKAVHNSNPHAFIVTHLEPMGKETAPTPLQPARDEAHITKIIQEIIAQIPSISDEHNVLIRNYQEGRYVSFHCKMPAATTIAQSHTVATHIQTALLAKLPPSSHVTVHIEPSEQ